MPSGFCWSIASASSSGSSASASGSSCWSFIGFPLGSLFILPFIPHLLVDSARTKVIHLTRFFFHPAVFLSFFIISLSAFFLVTFGTIANLAFHFLIGHVHCVLLIFNVLLLVLFASFLSKVSKIFIVANIFTNVFSTLALTKSSASFNVTRLLCVTVSLFRRLTEALLTECREGCGKVKRHSVRLDVELAEVQNELFVSGPISL
ncbi:hypothetical protein KC324_g60 [Hortaea werneckii]|nr:hypothetical protein KC324_g60 [Hortaea werneckii]